MHDDDPGRDPDRELIILRGAIENTNEGFVTIDENHRVVIFNRAAEKILGITREEILGQDLGLVLTPECSRGHRTAVARYLEDRTPRLIGHQSEFLTRRKNGETFPLSISFSVSIIGGKTFFTGIIQDLTETKALQAQVLESERLAALGQLAAEVSHEIKNPLIMIGGFARQLLRSAPEPKSRNKLQIIADEVTRLETLIGELRDLYRPKALEVAPVDIRTVLEEVHALVREDSGDRHIEAILDLPPGPLIVQGDRNKLKQVILNLVRNGIEAMDQGGRLTIRAQCTPEQLEITVTDEGPGIPEADQEKIFVPFYTTKKHGTGLGLSVSKRIIEEHAGCSFSLSSGKEKGAVARITMPAAACEIPASAGNSPAPKTKNKEKDMKPIQIAKDIYWVGVVDWNLRDFHGYLTEQGTTYNAYLLLDEKVTLVDTVKKEFADQLLTNIGEIIDPKKIDYVVSNHTEPDHSGGLPRIMHKIGESKPVYCSKLGLKNLPLYYREKLNYQPVENGGTLNIGKRNLNFLETRMVHWPDSMFTYCPEDRILFSSDGFGQHYAGPERFDDEIGEAIMPHAKKYFANILLLYAPLILQLVKKVTEMNLALDLICPDHGIMWRKDPMKIIQAYVDWSTQDPKKKAVVVYDTMWHSTQKMAEAIVAGLISEGIEARPMHLRSFHRSDIVTEVLDAGALLVGSPTLNNGLYPTVSDFLTYLKGLKPRKKLAAAFGSYGWSGEAVKLVNQELEAMKMDLVDGGLKIQFAPDDQALKAAYELGQKIGQTLKK